MLLCTCFVWALMGSRFKGKTRAIVDLRADFIVIHVKRRLKMIMEIFTV